MKPNSLKTNSMKTDSVRTDSMKTDSMKANSMKNQIQCLSAIKKHYDQLTNAEKKIADYICKNPEEIISLSVSELAKRTNSVNSAVIRCCKSIGFDGYKDFKIALVSELAKNIELNYVPYIHRGDNESQILDKVFSANVKTLHDTAEKINRVTLKNAIDALYEAKHIYIYGIGTSAPLVQDFQYRLMQIGFPAYCSTDGPSMRVSTLNIQPGDIAVGISNSGRTKGTIDSLIYAKQRKAQTMCLTSYENSLITKVCDYSIHVYSDEIQYPVETVSARIAHISVLDSIVIALSARNYDKAVERSRKTHEMINETVRYNKEIPKL